MLITFTTEHGALIIRSEDLRRLEDAAGGGCVVGWIEHDTVYHSPVGGTASENAARIVAEEAKLIAAYEAAQQQERDRVRFPVTRGRAAR
jgi:hypothetical protein